jgi:hypothetical protein
VSKVVSTIKSIGCIYPSVGRAMYDEPMARLSERFVRKILELE